MVHDARHLLVPLTRIVAPSEVVVVVVQRALPLIPEFRVCVRVAREEGPDTRGLSRGRYGFPRVGVVPRSGGSEVGERRAEA